MRTIHVAVIFVVLTGACSGKPKGSDEALVQQTVTVPALTAADSAAALEQGAAIAGAVAQGLAQRLQAQLKEEGAVGAVDFCSKAALALTDSLVATQPSGVRIKRTSTRIRNPRNLPDAHEQRALAWFDSTQSAAGRIPQSYIQSVSAAEVRFYKPLVIAPFCTQCHGGANQIEPRVQKILDERYPEDRAVGYKSGDLRGVIRVSLPRAAAAKQVL